MNDLLQQLHKIVPVFNVASIPKDATGAYASPVHIIAGLLDLTPVYIQKIINDICTNVNANCTKMKVTVNGTAQRNKIMVGDAKSIMGVLVSCDRQDMAAIVDRLPAVAPALQSPAAGPALQAPFVNVPARPPPSVAPAPGAPSVNAPARPPPSVAPAPQAPCVAPAPRAPSVNVPARPPPSVAPAPQVAFTPAPAPVQQIKKPLVLNGMVIEVDPVTSMVNATQMCRAGGKLYAHYSSTAEMTDFVQTLSLAIGIPIFDLVRTKPGHNGGTMVHRRVAMYLAQRISPLFNVQVTGYLDELLLTGHVELGKEKTPEELDAIFNRRIAEQQADVNNAFLREKNCLELSLLRIECSKRQREDAAAEEERVTKRQRDDYDNAKRQREDAAAEEERVAKRQREDYDNAKRQREDAAADDKAKEESRMQLVRFDAEIAFQANMSAEDLNLKRLECAKSLVEFNVNCLPMLTNSFKESLEKNVLLRSAMSDIEVNLARKINKCITGDDSGSSGYQETMFCDDFQTFLREIGRPMASTEELKKIGVFVSNKYYENFKTRPEKTMKIVNGTNCQVNAYRIEHKDFVERCIREFLDQATTSTTAAAPDVSVAKPLKDMRSFFGQFNCVNVINNK